MHRCGLFIGLLLLIAVFWIPTVTSDAQGGNVIHIVQEGETLTSIATHFGVTIEAIVAANKLASPDAIYVGQKLIIPLGGSGGSSGTAPQSSPPGTYTVQPGDTLIGIGEKLGVSVDDLMKANNITNPSLIQIGQVLKIPGVSSAPSGPSLPPLPDGQGVLSSSSVGPAINYEIAGGKLVSLTLQTTSTGKQGYPLSCESKVAGQIAFMYGLNFDETSFLNNLPHSLNPRRGFVGSPNGHFYLPRELIGNTASGPGGYGVHVEGWAPVFRALSGFQTRLLSSGAAAAQAQIDGALRQGYPVMVWAILGFGPTSTERSVWLGADANGIAIDCGGKAPNCSYLVSGEHTYLIIGRRGGDYLTYDPGKGEISYRSISTVSTGITAYFAGPTGSAPGAIIVPSAGHVPDMRRMPNW